MYVLLIYDEIIESPREIILAKSIHTSMFSFPCFQRSKMTTNNV